MGYRHHTTILHGVRVVRSLLDAGDAQTMTAVVTIMERLQATVGEPPASTTRHGWLGTSEVA
jgi:hypothetical protein